MGFQKKDTGVHNIKAYTKRRKDKQKRRKDIRGKHADDATTVVQEKKEKNFTAFFFLGGMTIYTKMNASLCKNGIAKEGYWGT